MRKKIITDTNIWYDLNSTEVLEISKNYILVIPIIVLNELYTSPNLWRSKDKFDKLKKAVKTIIDNKAKIEFIELDPFEFLLHDIFPINKSRLNLQEYLNALTELTTLEFEQVKDIRIDRYDISGFTNFINEKSIDYKKRVDSDKGKFKRLNTLGYMEKYILMLANDNLAQVDSSYPKMESLNNNKFEMLINTFDEMFREVSRSTMKLEDNDWIDIFNMTYVAKGELYWTKEKSKLRHIKSAGCEQYLFNQSYS
nr:hypothetical protein [uncultured Flavobacterium sp.]